jgi:hypothetical protein
MLLEAFQDNGDDLGHLFEDAQANRPSNALLLEAAADGFHTDTVRDAGVGTESSLSLSFFFWLKERKKERERKG